jgi:hypothetical protein
MRADSRAWLKCGRMYIGGVGEGDVCQTDYVVLSQPAVRDELGGYVFCLEQATCTRLYRRVCRGLTFREEWGRELCIEEAPTSSVCSQSSMLSCKDQACGTRQNTTGECSEKEKGERGRKREGKIILWIVFQSNLCNMCVDGGTNNTLLHTMLGGEIRTREGRINMSMGRGTQKVAHLFQAQRVPNVVVGTALASP